MIKKFNKFLLILLTLTFLLSGCSYKKFLLESCTYTPSNNIKSTDSPAFLELKNTTNIIEKIDLSNDNLQIYSRKPYIFICSKKYIIRCNILLSQIDTIIDIGKLPEHLSHNVTVSSDGNFIISYILNNSTDTYHTTGQNYFLIDINLQSVELLAECYSESAAIIAKSHIPDNIKPDYYNLIFSIDELKSDKIAHSKFIKSIYDKINNNYIWCSVLDSDTVAILAPTNPNDIVCLNNYSITIVDLNKDCAINTFFLE